MTEINASPYPNRHLLVSTDWVEKHREEQGIVLLDTRAKGYHEDHIPGAYWLDVQRLKDRSRHTFASADAVTGLLKSFGVTNDATIVVYDEGNSVLAARVFYVLEYYGLKDNVKLLHGGYTAWTAERRERSREVPAPKEGSPLSLSADPQLVTTKASIQAGLGERQLLDTRSFLEFTGEDKRSNRMAGHIKGAIHKEWSEALGTPDDNGVVRFKGFHPLRREFAAAGLDPAKTIVPYCQSNQRGAHSYFTLRLIGFPDIRPYEGSWEEWGNAENTEMAGSK
ncbi:sulfurtransferase [Paenibacillus sp. LPE1-1-1.1]|uniref:sulfurtransferase n=1 Tax=Paenibacillus sp. LPE1-1-1.1 TaxID=3135230 RepID=UPI003417921F